MNSQAKNSTALFKAVKTTGRHRVDLSPTSSHRTTALYAAFGTKLSRSSKERASAGIGTSCHSGDLGPHGERYSRLEALGHLDAAIRCDSCKRQSAIRNCHLASTLLDWADAKRCCRLGRVLKSSAAASLLALHGSLNSPTAPHQKGKQRTQGGIFDVPGGSKRCVHFAAMKRAVSAPRIGGQLTHVKSVATVIDINPHMVNSRSEPFGEFDHLTEPLRARYRRIGRRFAHEPIEPAPKPVIEATATALAAFDEDRHDVMHLSVEYEKQELLPWSRPRRTS